MINKGTKWIVITTRGVRTFTSDEYMLNYAKKRTGMILSITRVTEREMK